MCLFKALNQSNEVFYELNMLKTRSNNQHLIESHTEMEWFNFFTEMLQKQKS